MSTVAYKCPNCASALVYDGENMACRACGSVFDVDDIEARCAPKQELQTQFDLPTETYDASDAARMKAYHCQSCGARLVTEGTTTATACPYCGSPTILPDRIEGGIRPEMVVPFVVTKEQAQQMFHDYFKDKKLLPNIFKNNNQIAEMRKLFVPYWLFDCAAEGDILYAAEKEETTREGDWEITTIEHYSVRRSGNMGFENIPVDGSVKMDDQITESLEPYDLTKAVVFQTAVLSGALADHADVDAEVSEKRAATRAADSLSDSLRRTVVGYTRVNERSKQIHVDGRKVTPVLLPVWLITTVKEGKTYTFAINGQTGKLTCNVPTAKGKAFLWGLGSFGGVFGLAALVLQLMSALDDGTLFIAALVALFVAIGVVGVMISALKQAASQSGASDYVGESGLQLVREYDRYLYTKTTRRKIEKKE